MATDFPNLGLRKWNGAVFIVKCLAGREILSNFAATIIGVDWI
jgi:hypothetical protein